MTEPTKVHGTIASLKTWKSGKGFFLSITGDPNDYYKFGSCKFSEGANVTLEITEGTGSFDDKALITKMSPQEEGKAPEAGKVDVERHDIKDDIKDAKAVYVEKQESITRQCCLKAAARTVSTVWNNKQEPDWDKMTHKIMDMADMFYHEYFLRVESTKPEEE